MKVAGSNAGNAALLQPDNRPCINGNAVTVKVADIDEVMAWKNGFFHFVNADVPTVMRQLQRWYNIEVSYEGKIPVTGIPGKMQRDLNLSELLSLLEKAGLHVKMEGNNKLVVTP